SLGWRIKAMLRMGDYTALEEFLTGKAVEYKNAKLKNYLGFAYGQLADVQEQKGDFTKALFFLKEAVKRYEEIKDYFNCKQTVKDIGNFYFKHFGDGNMALVNYTKALTYRNLQKEKDLADTFESLDIYAQMAKIYVAANRFDAAFNYFQRAFDEIKTGTSEASILSSSSSEFIKTKKINYLTGLFIGKGDAFKQQYKSTQQKEKIASAIRSYKYADQLLDRIKMEQTDLDSKLFWRSDSRRLYEHAIDACYLAGDINDAFYFFEKSRAVLLQDQLKEQRWLGESDIMKQTQLSKRILHLEKELKSSDKTSKHYSDLQDTLFMTKQALENTKEAIKTKNPLYYQNFMDSDSITIRDVKQKILNDHEALVELFAGDSAVYVLAITKQNSNLQKINKIAFDNLSTAYVNYLSNADLLNRDFDSFTDISNQLYRILVQQTDLPSGRIIVSPDGRYFPFESLVINKQAHTYFLENFAVSYTYSARYLLNDFQGDLNSRPGTFFGVAPVQYKNGLAALSGSDQSLEAIQAFFRNSASLVGARATKNNFLSAYYRYRIVQLYTHATDSSSSSGDPAIYFADSTLSLSDLFYENRPASSLIVLSACETAEGKLYNGEGVFSFNRQFAALGIPSCVSTLWKADDQSTYAITELFYKDLARGVPIDVALQSAKKEFIRTSNLEHKLPYYWAASILVGKSDSIQLQKPFPWKWAIAAAAILGLVGFRFWQAKRRKTPEIKKTDNLVLQS
ncbi:MAG TPA: CHAT domain-containing protein, partial [Chitinophagaceae bacterium]|nr:CHAT domain-containing protein [Chitinophagaceae bacterium]